MTKKSVVLIILLILAAMLYGIYSFFFDMSGLPEGQLIAEAESPNGTYTIKAYLNNAHATTSFSIRGELTFNTVNKKPKNIYWNYREDNAIIEWINDNTVVINGHKLDVLNDKFDFRRQ